MKNVLLASATAIALLANDAALAATSVGANQTIDAINERYEELYRDFKAEGDRLGDRAPEGPETSIGIDFDVDMKRYEVILDLPTINMRERKIILDLPQATMKNRRFSFTTVKSKMENKKVGQYPEVHGLTIKWRDIITKVPVFWEEETSFVTKIPEFTWDQTTIIMHLPEVTMAQQRYVFDLPEVKIKEVSVETARIEADANNLEARTKATAAKHKAEIQTAVAAQLETHKTKVAAQFDTAIADLINSISQLRAKGIDPANANGTNVLAVLDELKQKKADALAQIQSAQDQPLT